MALSDDARRILGDFDATPSEEIAATLEMIVPNMRSRLTREYLAGKIDAVRSAGAEAERKALCKNLRPYLDWQAQGGG